MPSIKKFIPIVLCVFFAIYFPLHTYAEKTPQDILSSSVILYNGKSDSFAFNKKVKIDIKNPDVCTYVKNGRVMVPTRFLSTVYGSDIAWEPASKKITIRHSDKTIEIIVGKNTLKMNNTDIELDTPAEISNGRLFLPLRAMVEALDKKVFYYKNLIVISPTDNLLDPIKDKVLIESIVGNFHRENPKVTQTKEQNYNNWYFNNNFPLRYIAYSDTLKRYIAVGGYNTILMSNDSIHWKTIPNEFIYDTFRFVFWDGKKFIIFTNTYMREVLTSSDGVVWKKESIDFSSKSPLGELYSASYGKGKYVVLKNNSISYSSNGLNWLNVDLKHHNFSENDRVFFVNNLFVATSTFIKGSSSADKILISENGINWKSYDFSGKLNDLVWNGKKYVGVANNGTVVISSDCIKWSKVTLNIDNKINLYNILWNGSKFVLFGENPKETYSTQVAFSSSNGTTWSKLPDLKYAEPVQRYKTISKYIYAEGKFLSVDLFGRIQSSKDGINWVLVNYPLPSGIEFTDTLFHNNNNIFIGYSRHHPPQAVILTLGKDMAYRNMVSFDLSQESEAPTAITYGPHGYVMVGRSGKIWTSKDLTTWTQRDSGTRYELRDVIYAKGIYLAVGEERTILTSADGINWKTSILNLESISYLEHISLYGITYADGQFTAVGDCIVSSPDGIHWSLRYKCNEGDHFTSITYGDLGYVATNYANYISTSTDGIHWVSTQKLRNDESYAFWDVTYGNGVYMAAGSSIFTTAPKYLSVFVSVDGLNWRECPLGMNRDTYHTQYDNGYLSFSNILWNGDQFFLAGNLGSILVSGLK
ncbi:MAG: copper amine oxidase N-terminal domain-containing protein [Clostridia bacterium]|nr:copper amine oxidase N-terminal domain-containing protein [Clostridia bacterium]